MAISVKSHSSQNIRPSMNSDRDQVNDDAQRRRGGEALYGRHIAGDGGHQRPGLRAVVEAKRKPVQMLVDADAQIVGHPLPDAGGVVIVDVGGDRREDGNHQRRDAGEQRDAEGVATETVVMRPREPMRQLVVSKRVVEDQLKRPRRREAHRDLDQHGDENDYQPAPVGPHELQHQPRQLTLRHGRSG